MKLLFESMRLRLVGIITLSMVVTFLSSGCDKIRKEKEKEEDAPEPTVVERFYGKWSGFYQAVDEEGDDLDEPKACIATFYKDKTFEIQFLEENSARASGTWGEFGEESLFLMIRSSTISRLASSKAALNTEYDLTGDYLLIKGKSFNFKLARDTNTNTSDSFETKDFAGFWSCESNSGIRTELKLDSDGRWRGIISNGGTLQVSGTYPNSVDTTYLTVTAANDDKAIGAVLKLSDLMQPDAVRKAHLVIETSGDDLGTCTLTSR